MGLFAWLGSLLDELISWLGREAAAFLKGLISAIQEVWDTAIASNLILAFGADVVLYAIFYVGGIAGETLMEVWDPRYYNSKPSQVFNIRQAPGPQISQAPQDSPLPTERSKAKPVELINWA